MSGLLVVGASGHGKVVAEAAAQSGRWDDIAFADDRFGELNSWHRLPLVGSSQADSGLISRFQDVVIAIGAAATRVRLLNEFENAGFTTVTVIHPGAVVSSSATIGAGSVLLAGAIVNADVVIGRGCIINTSGSVDHDCRLGEAVHICPGATIAGGVSIGDCSWIGIGSSIIQGLTIGCNVTVGAGSAVTKNLPDGVTAVGVPARPLSKNEQSGV